jgi:hypothetical protein
MSQYAEIVKRCQENSAISLEVVDEFLINYAADMDRIDLEFEAAVKKHPTASGQLKRPDLNLMKSGFIAHRIFQPGGLIHKYLKHSAIRNLSAEEYDFLEFQRDHPWRYSFAEIIDSPEKNLHQMVDVFSNEVYMLYSPGMAKTYQEQKRTGWLNLIGFNGICWQTFSCMFSFRNFQPDDIFFFATELNQSIEDDDDLIHELARNPFPFLMLFTGAEIPGIKHKNHDIKRCLSNDPLPAFHTVGFEMDFTLGWNNGVYRLKHKKLGDFPHFAHAYYDEEKQLMMRSTMTEYSFAVLTKSLKKAGYALEEEPDIIVSVLMLTNAGNILEKKIEIDPYEHLFYTPNDEDQKNSEVIDKMNHFIQKITPHLNEGTKYDIKALAEEAGLSLEEAKNIVKVMKNKIRQLKKRYSGGS